MGVVTLTTAPGVGDVLGAWRLSPATAVLVVATVAYGVRAWRAGAWPWRRGLAYGTAVAVLAVALDGPVAVYGDVLFWVHMVQHLALIMVVPALLVWAQPLRLLRGGRGAVRTAPGSRAARLLTSPMLWLAVYAAVVVLTHLTGFQGVALADPRVRAGEELLYLATGYLLFLPLVGADAGPYDGPRALPYLLRFVVLALAMGVDTLTGVVLMLTNHPLAPGYGAAHPGWGPSALADQNIAGAVMWWGGDAVMMGLLIVVGIQWGRAPAAEQGMGSWIEGVRRRSLLGAGGSAEPGVDDDEAAWRAYNARLSALHRRDEGER